MRERRPIESDPSGKWGDFECGTLRTCSGATVLFQAKLPTPFAVLGVCTVGAYVTDIKFLPIGTPSLDPINPLAARACRQLEHYLADPRFRFNLPLELNGTPFQQRVWSALQAIPPGQTLTYLELARRIDSAPRPVGGACGANRLPLVVPCHRVVARHGTGGFMHAAAGRPVAIKQWLLRHEHA